LHRILSILPRKAEGERLEKVVSTKVTATHFKLLEKYARIRYNQNSISQPTISHLLRIIIAQWAVFIQKQESALDRKTVSSSPGKAHTAIRQI
jgi:hypothetical protein